MGSLNINVDGPINSIYNIVSYKWHNIVLVLGLNRYSITDTDNHILITTIFFFMISNRYRNTDILVKYRLPIQIIHCIGTIFTYTDNIIHTNTDTDYTNPDIGEM